MINELEPRESASIQVPFPQGLTFHFAGSGPLNRGFGPLLIETAGLELLEAASIDACAPGLPTILMACSRYLP
jgi:hypothetical protein